ncbi:MAG: hypothetical protein ACYDEX_12645 [Mobilitalea sp.]
MYPVTVLRILLIAVIGLILYWFILYIVGCGERRILKRRRRTLGEEREGLKAKIVLIYLVALFTVITLSFITIKYWIRGVK